MPGQKSAYNLKRLHVVFAIASLWLLAATVWMLAADRNSRAAHIQQIWLPDLAINYHSARAPRCDRCITCHQSIAGATARHSHPRLDLYVGQKSPHPATEFGCTICHDGQGSATQFRWASHTPDDLATQDRWRNRHGWFANPDWQYPMLPARFAESRCLLCHHDVTDLEPSHRFPDPPAPKLLAGYNLVRQYGCFGCHEIKGVDSSGRRVGPDMRLESKGGTLRKVGPNLRHTAERLSDAFIERWVREPAQFRPETRMPRFYGLHDALAGQTLKDTQAFEAVELKAIARYLLAASQPIEIPVMPAGQRDRGKHLFQTQGCLACHKHADFPDALATQGADLSRLGSKYTDPKAAAWLADWIADPPRHSPRTLMPNTLLNSDAAADIAAYLLASKGSPPDPPAALIAADLERLVALDSDGAARGRAAKGSLDNKLRCLGRQTIARRGCFGCHDIPGFESAQPIGPALSDWGRKDTSLLMFGQVEEFAARQTPSDPFFLDALLAHRREGFVWQKLRAPRSFDYKIADRKVYSEQLKMGRFQLDEPQIEQIATFILGLVADPPTARYVYQPRPPLRAVIDGRKLLDQFACAKCHRLAPEHWIIKTVSGTVSIVGMPAVDERGQIIEDEDDQGNPIYFITPWAPATFHGRSWPVGGAAVPVTKHDLARRRPPHGGDFARLLYPLVLADARHAGAAAPSAEVYGCLPPPLFNEGRKVQPAWLHGFLLNPTPIRPAAVLRMPKYHLSSTEAAKLANYFAAVDDVEFPYIAPSAVPPTNRLDRAVGLLLDRTTYCAKCHLIGDYHPGGDVKSTVAPNLDAVVGRLRPEYVHGWLADPRSILPYTPMPVNFPPTGPPRGQNIYPGTAAEQLDAVAELLLNFDRYMMSKTSVRKMIESKGTP